MRPPTPTVDTSAALSAYVDDRADRVDGRVGVCLARLDGAAEFDVLASHRPDRPYHAASVIKLPLVYALYRRHDGDLDALNEPRAIAQENRAGGTGLLRLLDGGEPTLRDLARATIAVSDNAATNELIDYVGVDAVNDAAEALGMTHTRLDRKMMTTGDGADDPPSADVATARDPGSEPTNTTSPLDCVRFFAELLHGDSLSDRSVDEIVAALLAQQDGSLFPRYLPWEDGLAHKTGGLPGAALDTGVVDVDDDAPLCFAVFVEGIERTGDGTDVVAEIGDATFAWYKGCGRSDGAE